MRRVGRPRGKEGYGVTDRDPDRLEHRPDGKKMGCSTAKLSGGVVCACCCFSFFLPRHRHRLSSCCSGCARNGHCTFIAASRHDHLDHDPSTNRKRTRNIKLTNTPSPLWDSMSSSASLRRPMAMGLRMWTVMRLHHVFPFGFPTNPAKQSLSLDSSAGFLSAVASHGEKAVCLYQPLVKSGAAVNWSDRGRSFGRRVALRRSRRGSLALAAPWWSRETKSQARLRLLLLHWRLAAAARCRRP